jgi:16S rRNA (uracil1498-N3)-methyltransferase
LGALGIIPWQAERSISRWDETKAAKGQARWQSICDEAAKQSLRAWHPRVAEVLSSQALAKTFEQFDKVLVLDPTAAVGIAQVPEFNGRLALIVGPEGGIDDSELAMFEAAGAIRVRLGQSILRTSTAGIVAISALQYASGDFA